MILPRVRRTLRQRGLLPRGARVLLGLSGGPDSAALLVALAQLADEFRLTLVAASVDHGLRTEAAAEVRVACAQAGAFGVDCQPLAIQIAPGAGLQARARVARYRALLAHAHVQQASFVAVGHTLDDQAETVLMRQLRGSGLRGLSGIAPRRDDGVVRPLIDCPREEVHHFARAHLVDLVEDRSNRDRSFERVRVRERLLPALALEDPQVRRHLADLADEARIHVGWIDARARRALRCVECSPGSLELSELRVLHPVLLPALFRLWLRGHGARSPSRAHLAQLQGCLSGRGEVRLGNRWCVRVEGPRLRLRRGATLE